MEANMYCAAKIKLSKDTWAIQTKADTRVQEGVGLIIIDGGGRLPVCIVAFDRLADELAKYQVNSIIKIKGRFKINTVYHAGGFVNGYQEVVESLGDDGLL